MSNPSVHGAPAASAASTVNETVAAPGELAGLRFDRANAGSNPQTPPEQGGSLAARAGRLRKAPAETDPDMTGRFISSQQTGAASATKKTADTARKSAPARTSANREIVFSAAPLWRRLVATLVDGGVIASLIIFPIREGWFGERAQSIRPWEPDDIGRALFEGHLTVPLILTSVAVLVLGCVPHGLAGRSFGKLLTGLVLVNNWTGERPGWTQVIIRQVIGLLTTVLGISSYLWFIVDRRRSALHDRLTGTSCVVAGSGHARSAR